MCSSTVPASGQGATGVRRRAPDRRGAVVTARLCVVGAGLATQRPILGLSVVLKGTELAANVLFDGVLVLGRGRIEDRMRRGRKPAADVHVDREIRRAV